MRQRDLATLLVLSVGWFAVVATSTPSSRVSVEPESGSVRLDSQQPELRVPFTFSASDVAKEGRLSVVAGLTRTWLGRAVPLEVTWNTPIGSFDSGPHEQASCGLECIGESELVVRWPLENEGAVVVDWTLGAAANFGSDEPPDGAQVSLEAEPPDDYGAAWQPLDVHDDDALMTRAELDLSLSPDVEAVVIASAAPSMGVGPAEFELTAGGTNHRLMGFQGLLLQRDELCDNQGCRVHIFSSGYVPRDGEYLPRLKPVPQGQVEPTVDKVGLRGAPTSPIHVSWPMGEEDAESSLVLEVDYREEFSSWRPPLLAVTFSGPDPGLPEDASFTLRADQFDARYMGWREQEPQVLYAPLDCTDGPPCRVVVETTGRVSDSSFVTQLEVKGRVFHPKLENTDEVGLAWRLVETDAD